MTDKSAKRAKAPKTIQRDKPLTTNQMIAMFRELLDAPDSVVTNGERS